MSFKLELIMKNIRTHRLTSHNGNKKKLNWVWMPIRNILIRLLLQKKGKKIEKASQNKTTHKRNFLKKTNTKGRSMIKMIFKSHDKTEGLWNYF